MPDRKLPFEALPSRRNFLKALGGATVLPFAGKIVLANPFVLAPSGVAVPERANLIAASADDPLLVVTDTTPTMVNSLGAYVNSCETDVHFDTINLRSIRGGGYGLDQIANTYGTTINMRLNLTILPEEVTSDQLNMIFAPKGGVVRFYVEPPKD